MHLTVDERPLLKSLRIRQSLDISSNRIAQQATELSNRKRHAMTFLSVTMQRHQAPQLAENDDRD